MPQPSGHAAGNQGSIFQRFFSPLEVSSSTVGPSYPRDRIFSDPRATESSGRKLPLWESTTSPLAGEGMTSLCLQCSQVKDYFPMLGSLGP